MHHNNYWTERCPACNETGRQLVKTTHGGAIYCCTRCRCLYGRCDEADSYALVKGAFLTGHPPEQTRPYDLLCLGPDGAVLRRRHGFYDPSTRLITQVG